MVKYITINKSSSKKSEEWLDFDKGEVIELIEKKSDKCWYGTRLANGKNGKFNPNLVLAIPDVALNNSSSNAVESTVSPRSRKSSSTTKSSAKRRKSKDAMIDTSIFKEIKGERQSNAGGSDLNTAPSSPRTAAKHKNRRHNYLDLEGTQSEQVPSTVSNAAKALLSPRGLMLLEQSQDVYATAQPTQLKEARDEMRRLAKREKKKAKEAEEKKAKEAEEKKAKEADEKKKKKTDKDEKKKANDVAKPPVPASKPPVPDSKPPQQLTTPALPPPSPLEDTPALPPVSPRHRSKSPASPRPHHSKSPASPRQHAKSPASPRRDSPHEFAAPPLPHHSPSPVGSPKEAAPSAPDSAPVPRRHSKPDRSESSEALRRRSSKSKKQKGLSSSQKTRHAPNRHDHKRASMPVAMLQSLNLMDLSAVDESTLDDDRLFVRRSTTPDGPLSARAHRRDSSEQKHHYHHASPGDRAKQLFTSDAAARKGKKKSFNKSSPSLKSSTESYGQLRRADSETYGGSKHLASPAHKHGTMPAPRRQSAGHPGERAPSPPRRRSDVPARVTSPPPRNPAPFPSAVIDATIAEYMSTSAAESLIAAKPPLPPDLPPVDDADASEVRRRSDAPTPKGAAPVPPAVAAKQAEQELWARRGALVAQIVRTEQSFVDSLTFVVDLYIEPLKAHSLLSTVVDIDLLSFAGALVELQKCNAKLLKSVEKRVKSEKGCGDKVCVGDLFVNLCDHLDAYAQYFFLFQLTLNHIDYLSSECDVFESFCKEAASKSNGVDLKGLIMAPIQSIVRYLMLLKELLTVTPVTHVDHPQLKLAQQKIRQFGDEMHERRKQKESQASKISFLNTIDSCPIRLSEPERYLLAQGTVTHNGNDATLSLFSDVLVCTSTPNKEGQRKMLWYARLSTCEMKQHMKGKTLHVSIDELRWQPTPPFHENIQRSFSLQHRPNDKDYIDWSVKIAIQLEQQNQKTSRMLTEGRGQYLEKHSLTDLDMKLLTMRSTTIELQHNNVLFNQNQDFPGLFLIEQGQIVVMNQVNDEAKIVTTLMPGSFVGTLSFLRGQTLATCVAQASKPGETIKLRRLNEPFLKTVLSSQHDVSERFYQLLAVSIANMMQEDGLRTALKLPSLNRGVSSDILTASVLRAGGTMKDLYVVPKSNNDQVLIKSLQCIATKDDFRMGTLLHVFRDTLTFQYRLFGLTHRTILLLTKIKDISKKGKTIHVQFEDIDDDDNKQKYKWSFVLQKEAMANELKQLLSDLLDEHPAAAQMKQTPSILFIQKYTTMKQNTQLLYRDLKSRDDTLMLSPNEFNQLFSITQTLNLTKGDVVLTEGWQHRRLWQISAGTCDVTVSPKDGARASVVVSLEAGDVFGELSFLIGGEAPASIVVTSDRCIVMFVERHDVSKLFDENISMPPKFFKFLALLLNQKMHLEQKNVIDLYCKQKP